MTAPPERGVRCLLDECLPFQVADALALVGHPLLSVRGTSDEELIPWMGRERLIWITKDDAARRQHLGPLRAAQLSVVWVRGVDRRKAGLDLKQLHLLLTNRLPDVIEKVAGSRSPLWFLLYLESGGKAVLKPTPAFERLPGDTRERGVR